MSLFDENDSQLIRFTTQERMVSALGINVTAYQAKLSGNKFRAKLISTTKEETRTPSINYKSGEWNCSCEDYVYTKKICKHCLALIFWVKLKHMDKYLVFLEALGRPEYVKYASVEATGYMSTQLKSLDGLMRGGLPKSIVTGYIGNPKIGKTWLLYHTAVACNFPVKQGGAGRSALIINTEADFLRPGVQETFRKYYTLRYKDLDFKIDFLFPRTIYMLFDLFGLGIHLKKSSKRVTPSIWDNCNILNSPIAALQRLKGYGFIGVDSLTMPLKKEVPVPPNQNTPSRAACINTIWGKFEYIAEKFQIPVVVTHHCTKDPMSKAFGNPYGGDTILYNMKHVLHVLHGTKQLYDKIGSGARRILRARWPGRMKTQIEMNLAPNVGFADVT